MKSECKPGQYLPLAAQQEQPKNKYDKTGMKRQSRRNQQLEQAARNNGFDSLSQMLTAIMKEQAVVVKMTNRSREL